MIRKESRRAAISFRADEDRLGLIDLAAQITGENRTEFMMDASTRKAEDVLLERRLFVLGDEDWAAFEAILDAPNAPNERLKRMMQIKPRWAESITGNGVKE